MSGVLITKLKNLPTILLHTKKHKNISSIVYLSQHVKVLSHFEDAKFLLGGNHYELPYIQPIIIINITTDMVLVQDETFGSSSHNQSF